MSDLNEAAARWREHLEWLQFRGALKSPHDGNEAQNVADTVALCGWAVERLAADERERLEREKPIDEAFLTRSGFRPFGGALRIGDGSHGGYVDVTIARGAMTANLVEWRHEPMPTVQSRGQLLDLLKALGVQP